MISFELVIVLLFIFLVTVTIVSLIAYVVKIIPQSQAYVIERLGAYYRTLSTGLHFVVPILDRISSQVTLKEQVYDFPPQSVITKDNVTMEIDTVLYFQITDAKMYTYGIVNPLYAIEKLTSTTLRNIIGELELDETLTSRDLINTKMRVILDEATDPWGIKVNRVEVKNIDPPKEIMSAMEKQMKAERERRELILRAEGEKASAILVAEGEKASTVLRAEAKREAAIIEAEGQARALERVYQAQALGIELINNSNPQAAFLQLKSFEAMEKVANGQSTKLIIPSNLQDFTTLVASAAEVLNSKKE